MAEKNDKSPRSSIVLRLRPGKPTVATYIDLVGDRWDDYKGQLLDARAADDAGDLNKRNRHIREAIVSLVSHWDGIITDLERLAQRGTQKATVRFIPNPQACLCARQSSLRFFAEVSTGKRVRKLPFISVKALRNIVIHPVGNKRIGRRGQNDHDLYDLTPEMVLQEGKVIAQSLDELCAAFGCPRLIDPKWALEFLGALGFPPAANKRI